MIVNDKKFNCILHEDFFELAEVIKKVEEDVTNLVNSPTKQNILIDLAILRDRLLKYRVRIIQVISDEG